MPLQRHPPTLPNDAVPVDIQKQSESILFQFATTNEKSSPTQSVDDTKWRQGILQHLTIIDMMKFNEDLDNKDITINIVSDRGVHHYHSNFGLVIATKFKIVAQNMGQIYSVEFHESSYRLEHYGMLTHPRSI